MRMSLSSSARVSGEQHEVGALSVDGRAFLSARRGLAALLATLILFATVGVVLTTGGVARAAIVFQSGQVFASVGNSTVNVYDSSGNSLASLVDNNGEPYVTGSAFDNQGNFYVNDDLTGAISKFSQTGQYLGNFATGLTNPASLEFDTKGNLYVGQQGVPFIAEFDSNGNRLKDIGPVYTEETGVDWIDLSSDQCTFYYTTETATIFRYNKCTGMQLTPFNSTALPGSNAFELRILPNGDVLVADAQSVEMLDPNGNDIQSYPCSNMPNCAGLLFGLVIDPSGTSFWTGDMFSGDIWQVNIATGQVMKTIATGSPFLGGLSVDGQIEVADTATTVAATPTSLSVNPVSGDFSTPTPVSAVLTNSSTDTPIAGEPVTFTLNGNETCTATTDSTGTATCVITPGEPSQSYTLTASFSGDTSNSTPVGSDSSSNTFTVTPDSSTLTYTGPTTAVNGQPTTLTGDLTTDVPTPGTPLPDKVVTFSVGSGPTTQSCSGMTDQSGAASCTVSPVDQPVTDTTITSSFPGGAFNSPSSTTTGATVTEPTTLTVHSATSDYADQVTVSGVLTDAVSNQPIAGEPVTLTLGGKETCTATTDANGQAACPVTPSEPAGTYALTGSFAGDATLPLQLTGSSNSANFVVTLEESSLTYTGATVAQNGQPLNVSGVLTTDDPAQGAPIVGRSVTFVLGSGAGAQTCSAVSDATGTVACSIASVNQSPGPVPVTDTFAGDTYYKTASASSTVNLPEATKLVVNPISGAPYNGQTPLSGTLDNTFTGNPVPNEPVTFTINGTQSCTADTNASGYASCSVAPNEPTGTYSFTASFPGDNSSQPQLNPSDTTSTITVVPAQTTLTYSGPTTLTNGSPATFSGTVTSSEPTSGTDVPGVSVTFTVGSGPSLQSCTGTTDANGNVSCTIPSVNQSTGTVGVMGSFSGNNYYESSATSATDTVHTPTTLTVSATSGTYGSPTTLTGDLTNSVNGQPVGGEPVTLTLNGTQSCNATTNANGIGSCSVTPNEPAGSYTATGTFGGFTPPLTQPILNPSGGSNTVVVTKAPTTATSTSPTLAVNGSSLTLSANVGTTVGSGVTGQPVTLTLGSGSSAQSCTGTISASGTVTCTIANVNQTSGVLPVTVTYGGNSYYQSSSNSSTIIVASMPDTGGFVVGDVSSNGTSTVPMSYGTITSGTSSSVNFWSSQLWKRNVFTGVDNAPASMKGYINNSPPLNANTCTSGPNHSHPDWTSDPGNSSNPPATLPTYLTVVVSSFINQNSSTEWGDVKHIAVVQVVPGYGPAPGHNGFGPIVGWLC